MKGFRIITPALACSLGLALLLIAQDGPNTGGSETVARPKKGTAPAPEQKEAPPIPSEFKKPKDLPAGIVTFSSEATTVSVDVAVLNNKGQFIPKIPQGNFRILEDNVPQKVNSFSVGEAPMTIAMVVEFSNLFQQAGSESWNQTRAAAFGFAQTLQPQDYLAVVAFDLRPEILSDFSTDRRDAQEAFSRMTYAAYSESNMFDAVADTAQRMQDIEGRKAILLIASGVDTFSKLTFAETRKIIQNSGVPIYAVGLLQAVRDIAYARGRMSDSTNIAFLQADNQMRTFAKESGGMSFFPQFYGQFHDIFQAIHQAMRSEYVLTYQPTNQAHDGKFRKIKVELVDPANNQPLKITENGKPIKYEIIAKSGYTAPRAVE